MRYDFSQDYIIKIRGKPEQIRDWIREISLFMDKGVSYMIMEKEIHNFDNLETIVEPIGFTFGDAHQIYFKNNYLWYSPCINGNDKKIYFDKFKLLFDDVKKRMDEKHFNQMLFLLS
jgi:hypothetical protein